MSEAMIDKIRGLLAKAESTEFEGEADLLLKKAAELMAKYRIDEAVLAASGKAADDPIERRYLSVGKWDIAKGGLAVALCEAFDCHALWAKKKTLALIGHTSDLDTFTALFTSLEIQLDRELLKVTGYDTGSTRSARSSFAYGWCSRVGARVKEHYTTALDDEMQTHNEVESSSVALVLKSREENVSAKYQEFYGRTPRYTYKSHRTSNYSAYGQGQNAGNRADIGAGAIRGNRGQITT